MSRFITRFRSAASAAVLSLATGLVALPAVSQEGKGEVVLYYGMSRAGVQPAIDAFQAKTGITVRSLRQPTEELMSTIALEARAGSVNADVVFISEAQIKALQDSYSLFRAYEPEGFENVPDGMKDPEGRRIPTLAALYVIQYNTNLVSADEAPKSFSDLLDPKWSNKVVIADPQSSSSVHGLLWLITEKLKDKGAPYDWSFFKTLAENNVMLAGGHGNIRDLVVSGERPVGVQVVGTANQSVKAGEPTAFNWPAEGTSAEILAIGIVENGSNAANAEALVNFFLSLEGQTTLAENTGHAPVRSDAEFYYVDGKNVGNLDIDAHAVDVSFIADRRNETMDAFEEATGK